MQHVLNEHGFERAEYERCYGPAVSSVTHAKYSAFNKINGNWIGRANAAGRDLTDYRIKMGDAVRASVMSNFEERTRRSRQMAINNKTPEARTKSSVTAKITSARPDIIEARTKRLQNSYKPSKPERFLEDLLVPVGFKRNYLISDTFFSKPSHRRQVDFIDHNRKIMIEFDGAQHFHESWKRMPLTLIQQNDRELDEWAINHGYVLIRVGYSQYKSRDNMLLRNCIHQLFELFESADHGKVYYLGEEYGDKNSLIVGLHSTHVEQVIDAV